jgi:hypothetical protein
MKFQRELLIILIPALILTILWVASNVYHNFATSTIQDPLTYQIIPIEGSFDKETIERTKTRIRVEPYYENIAIETLSPTPTPSEKLETASKSAIISPAPTGKVNKE